MGEEGGNCLSDLAPGKKLGADHLRLRSPVSGAVFDRQQVNTPPSAGISLQILQASLRSLPLFFTQKLRALIQPPVKHRQTQLVSLNPLVRCSGAQGRGQTYRRTYGRNAGSAGSVEQRGSWGTLESRSTWGRVQSHLCSGPPSTLTLPIISFYRSSAGEGNCLGSYSTDSPRRTSDPQLGTPGKAREANEGTGVGESLSMGSFLQGLSFLPVPWGASQIPQQKLLPKRT